MAHQSAGHHAHQCLLRSSSDWLDRRSRFWVVDLLLEKPRLDGLGFWTHYQGFHDLRVDGIVNWSASIDRLSVSVILILVARYRIGDQNAE
ncbi:hypothetical protein M404DRAFT_560506 [Pisolithus tinctorius Marx 270]|uniref:Uncharacterized protein n=1 Tax=Pisolithus tinctorius Marx 270 TaxID=870435 RepID=A0A0C3JVG8_PISTI|nr:hypothetical protein M404DRAFT_560506 [Pisolithus tinctorius Marx 270]